MSNDPFDSDELQVETDYGTQRRPLSKFLWAKSNLQEDRKLRPQRVDLKLLDSNTSKYLLVML